MSAPISAADFKTRFDRNFVYGSGLDTVRDKDIEDAIAEAQLSFNPSLFSTDDGKVAFLFATAHVLTVNIQAAGGLHSAVSPEGITNRSQGIAVSKTVGQVSITYEPPPERIKKLPTLLAFWETEYGKAYVRMLIPKLAGNVGVVSGPVDPLMGAQPVPFVGP